MAARKAEEYIYMYISKSPIKVAVITFSSFRTHDDDERKKKCTKYINNIFNKNSFFSIFASWVDGRQSAPLWFLLFLLNRKKLKTVDGKLRGIRWRKKWVVGYETLNGSHSLTVRVCAWAKQHSVNLKNDVIKKLYISHPPGFYCIMPAMKMIKYFWFNKFFFISFFRSPLPTLSLPLFPFSLFFGVIFE